MENLPFVKLSGGSGGPRRGPGGAPPGPPQGGPGGAPLFHFSIFPFVLRTIADRPPTGHSCSKKLKNGKMENLPLVKLSGGSGGPRGRPGGPPPGPPQGGPGGAPLFHFSIFQFALRTIADRPPTGHSCSKKWKNGKMENLPFVKLSGGSGGPRRGPGGPPPGPPQTVLGVLQRLKKHLPPISALFKSTMRFHGELGGKPVRYILQFRFLSGAGVSQP
jgi:hypothetical protein